jgi:hypothetical protein
MTPKAGNRQGDSAQELGDWKLVAKGKRGAWEFDYADNSAFCWRDHYLHAPVMPACPGQVGVFSEVSGRDQNVRRQKSGSLRVRTRFVEMHAW